MELLKLCEKLLTALLIKLLTMLFTYLSTSKTFLNALKSNGF